MRPTRLLLALTVGGCASAPAVTMPAQAPVPAATAPAAAAERPAAALPAGAFSRPNADPFPSTYTPFPSRPTVIRNVNILTAAGPLIRNGAVLMVDGKVAAVGASVNAPADAIVIDGQGKYVTPGLIDTHSHLGVYPAPNTAAHQDGNEATAPVTAHVWAEHSVWPQDPQFPRDLAGGTTTIQVLPGSANLIGGRSFTAKLKLKGSAREMRFPGAPQGLKMACGENPKRVYGSERNGLPSTRMGNVHGYRKAFQDALEYRRRWQKYDRDLELWRQKLLREEEKAKAPPAHPAPGATAEAGAKKPDEELGPLDPPDPPARDLELETLARVLDGGILVHNHCYRADEMNLMLDLAREFRFKIRSFHHAVEAYKLRDRLASEGVAVSTWVDWWGFKMESLDGVRENAALVADAGARAILHSDSESEVRHLNQEAAKALTAGRRLGLKLDDNEALRWITANPAWALGVEEQTGTLTVGKMGDVVVWDRHPFSVYAHAEQVFIDGERVFERGKERQVTDFELTLPQAGDAALTPPTPVGRIKPRMITAVRGWR